MRKILFVLSILSFCLISFVLTGNIIANNKQEDIVTVTVKGLGIDKESALKDALRKAVEKGGKIKIYSESKTENYVLIRDTILARASGLIKDYKIISEGADDLGGYFVKIRARVDRKLVDATWGQVEILLRQLGRPKILVSFVERIYDVTLPADKRERVDADSMLGNKIESLLVEKGFELVDKNQLNQLKKNKLIQATLKGDTGAIKRLAGELGAQMFIVGNARGSGPQITNAYGAKLYMWETDVTLKAFWAETAQVLFAKSEVGTRSGSRTPGPPGCKKAIAKAGDKLAKECLQAILAKWSQVATGGGKIIVEVKNISFKQMLKLQKELKKIKGVKSITRKWHKPVVKYEIVTTDSAEIFAEKLAEMELKGFSLDIEDQNYNTINAVVTTEKQ